ncbi:oxidoreductase molybdopterin binding protein [Hyaloraphidium curvatum]|nr:oxidoreductase molybdopterin binding protein [Hyaloraphidium curvatum]
MEAASDSAGGHELDPPPEVVLEPPGLTRRIPLLPHQMTERITPAADLFVLAHLGVARAVSPESWTLDVVGLVSKHLRLSVGELNEMPRTRIEAVHQCAGSPLEPTVPTRRVACVVWEGVLLSRVLELAGAHASATYIWADGADAGEFVLPGEAAPRRVPCFRKDIPISRLPEDVLLALSLNGAPLPSRHGGPLRLVVPGFYGTCSVKWLTRLTLADRRADGLFAAELYNDPVPGGRKPVWNLAPEAIVVSPAPGAVVGRRTRVSGWAWSDSPVVRVEISSSDGREWADVELEPRREREWQAWSALLDLDPGEVRLMVRATDNLGNGQPLEGQRNAVHSVQVLVEDR